MLLFFEKREVGGISSVEGLFYVCVFSYWLFLML